MGQLYLQRFEYRGAIDKTAFDKTWETALTTFAETGNWGGVAKGVTHRHTYGTGWGGYALIEVDDPEAFAHYQAHHNQHYGHLARISWEPLFDMDAAFGPALKSLRAKAR
jgi:hypothetical protein